MKENIIEIREEVRINQKDLDLILEKGDKIRVLNEDELSMTVYGDLIKNFTKEEVLFKNTPFKFYFKLTSSNKVKSITVMPDKYEAYNLIKGRGLSIDLTPKKIEKIINFTRPFVFLEAFTMPNNPNNLEKGTVGTYIFKFSRKDLKPIFDRYLASLA